MEGNLWSLPKDDFRGDARQNPENLSISFRGDSFYLNVQVLVSIFKFNHLQYDRNSWMQLVGCKLAQTFQSIVWLGEVKFWKLIVRK